MAAKTSYHSRSSPSREDTPSSSGAHVHHTPSTRGDDFYRPSYSIWRHRRSRSPVSRHGRPHSRDSFPPERREPQSPSKDTPAQRGCPNTDSYRPVYRSVSPKRPSIARVRSPKDPRPAKRPRREFSDRAYQQVNSWISKPPAPTSRHIRSLPETQALKLELRELEALAEMDSSTSPGTTAGNYSQSLDSLATSACKTPWKSETQQSAFPPGSTSPSTAIPMHQDMTSSSDSLSHFSVPLTGSTSSQPDRPSFSQFSSNVTLPAVPPVSPTLSKATLNKQRLLGRIRDLKQSAVVRARLNSHFQPPPTNPPSSSQPK